MFRKESDLEAFERVMIELSVRPECRPPKASQSATEATS
jgi:hypothetical protein